MHRRRCRNPPAISSPTAASRSRRTFWRATTWRRPPTCWRRRSRPRRASCSAWFASARRASGWASAPPPSRPSSRSARSTRRTGSAPGLHLVRLGALPAGDMPAAYVRTLFDQYAPRFDAALTEGLAYRGPALLRDAIETACAAARRPMRFPDMLDLGCGTGLAGAAFRPFVRRLTGVDLSDRMVAVARGEEHLRPARDRRSAAIPARRRRANAPSLFAHRGGRRVRLSGLAAARSSRRPPARSRPAA